MSRGASSVINLPEIHGPSGLLVGFAAMVAAAMTPLPTEIVGLAIAVRHGFWPAIGLMWLGAMTGALLCYALARRVSGRGVWIDRNAAVRRAQDRLIDMGWLGILGLRLIPLVPFFALSLAAGLLRLPLGGFLGGTAVGILPASVLVAAIGQGMIDESGRMIALGVLGLLALALLGLLLRRR